MSRGGCVNTFNIVYLSAYLQRLHSRVLIQGNGISMWSACELTLWHGLVSAVYRVVRVGR